MATTSIEKPNEPIILQFEWTAKKETDVDEALTALKVSTSHQLTTCPGVFTYAFRRIDANTIRLTEVYRDTNTFWSHIPSGYISDKLQFLFDTSVRARAKGVGVGQLPEGVKATVAAMGGHSSPLMAGSVVNSSFAAPRDSKPVLLTMSVTEGFAEEATRELVLSTLAPLIRAAENCPEIHTCAVFHNENDTELVIVSASESALVSLVASVASSVLDPLRDKFKVATEVCGEISPDSDEKLLATGISFQKRPLDAGYALHPALCNSSTQQTANQQPTSVSELPTTDLFTLVIDPYTKEPTTIKFSQNAPGRSPHQYSTPLAKPLESEGTLNVPLMHIVRKLTGSGGTDIDLPIPKLFGILERLRSWQRCMSLFNRSIFNGEQLSDEEQYFVETFVENLHNVGYPTRAKDKRVEIDGLNEFIQTIEWAMRDVIKSARQSLATSRQVAYKGLMETFPIGSVVVGQASGLGGAHVAYRVFDCYMSTQRSMFGTSKYVFTLGLEFVVNFGSHFCVCNFEDKIEEYEGERDLSALPYVPLVARPNDLPMFVSRGKAVAALGIKPVYRSYASGAFFAHLQGSSSNGGPAGVHQAGSGRCMIDNERGLMLGHAPGTSFDGAGTAIQSTLKVFRIAVRATNENDSEAAKQERIKNAKLRLFKHLPGHFEVITWPAVVAYSFTWKTWGHVLTSGLSEVQFSDEPWNQLVLPKRTKELLFASVLFNLSGAPGIGDLIKGKSQGALYLLYGPPGTGKTLTVEAMAEKFKLPLYTVSLGELGTGAKEVDMAINNILALCAQWKAIVLLDEGDALLEQREKGKLEMNSLTGVLLRSLENFDGQLFITSNRLQHIDRAVLSRVTLAVKYNDLDAAARGRIWQNTLTRAGVDLAKFDIEALAKYEISGRELLHIVKLGLALAYHHNTPLTQDLLVDALEESLEFRSHFPTTAY